MDKKIKIIILVFSCFSGHSIHAAEINGPAISYSTPSTGVSVIINKGALAADTNEVRLDLAALGAEHMMISNFPDFKGSSWEIFASEKNWRLEEGAGLKHVYALFRNEAGSTSLPAFDMIEVRDIIVAGVESDWRAIELEKIAAEAAYLYGIPADIARNIGRERDLAEEARVRGDYTKNLLAGLEGEYDAGAITGFILYGTETTDNLGAGERTGVLDSYKAVFNRLPLSAEEWSDVLKIASGRWPGERNSTAEEAAKEKFRKVYLKDPDMQKAEEEAAVTIMAYGLRPSERNLESEKEAINIFKSIFNRDPVSAPDWDIVRAVAYSGAKR